jgi:hypothetical protein
MRHEIPHRMNRDAVEILTEADLALRLAIADLPAAARALAADPRVTVVTWDDPRVPEELLRRSRRHMGYRGTMPSVCRHDDIEDTFLLVIGEIADLGHELIHVAQVLADDDAVAAAFAQVAADGARLVRAARDAVRAGLDPVEHRDLTWCRNAAHPRNDTPPRPGEPDEGMITTFDLHAQVHPVPATRTLGESLGMDRRATLAAMFAYYLAANGIDRPRSSPAMECVAYRYERDLGALADLFQSALVRAQA